MRWATRVSHHPLPSGRGSLCSFRKASLTVGDAERAGGGGGVGVAHDHGEGAVDGIGLGGRDAAGEGGGDEVAEDLGAALRAGDIEVCERDGLGLAGIAGGFSAGDGVVVSVFAVGRVVEDAEGAFGASVGLAWCAAAAGNSGADFFRRG